MRCVSCNKNLNNFESTLKSIHTGQYLDMCRHCLDDAEIDYTDKYVDTLDEEDFEEYNE